MKRTNIILIALIAIFGISNTYAAFPDDLDDVVFIEETSGAIPGVANFVRSFQETSLLTVSLGSIDPTFGRNLELVHERRSIWPAGRASQQLGCCNANVWGFVLINGTWFGGSWEFIRTGSTTRSTAAFVGPNHFRFAPLNNFRPVNGEIYAFMLAGLTRAGLATNNIRERTNVVFFRFGVGQISREEAQEALGVPLGAPQNTILPPSIINLLLEEATPE